MKEIINAYLKALEAGDYPAIVALFAEDALVNSPLYGEKNARDFFRELLEDTDHAVLTPLRIFTNPDSSSGAAYFLYEWILDNGRHASFHVVDIFDFNEAGKIQILNIVYDTALTRPAYEAQQQG